MISILRNSLFILIPVALLFIIGFSGKDSHKELNINNSNAFNKSPVANEISVTKATTQLRDINLFTSNTGAGNDMSGFADNVTILSLDESALNTLYSEKPNSMTFNIPVGDGFVQLELTKVNILDEDFRITTNDNGVINRHQDYEPGVHYRGIIKGNDKSLASISVFPDFVIGLVSDEYGNYNLGSMKDENGNNTGEYIFYNDADIVKKNEFICGVNDLEQNMRIYNPNNENPVTSFDDPSGFNDTLRVYFECDFAMYQDNGSNLNNVGQFVEGMYNSVVTIYRNENINVSISEIRAYTSPDPYSTSSNSEDILVSFGHNSQDNFYGDLAHLLSTRPENMGGIAWINVLCLPYQSQQGAGRYAFSNIDNTYSNYPVHSWTVNVVAHEMGHNFGSQHTHACAWPVFGPGSMGAIDSCFTAEGFCFSTTRPKLNGTIMSYCHLNGSISLTAGFGPLPGDTIRLRYQQAGCIQNTTNSSEPQAFTLDQNYPNPFNPGTTIRFELPEDAFVSLVVYDMAGREVSNLVSGQFFNEGVFSYYFDAGRFSLASGVYFYRLTAYNSANKNESIYTQVRKMILIK